MSPIKMSSKRLLIVNSNIIEMNKSWFSKIIQLGTILGLLIFLGLMKAGFSPVNPR
jgi:hypothetical protein